MPRLTFKLMAVVQEFPSGEFYGEVLRLPGVTSLADTSDRLLSMLERSARIELEESDPGFVTQFCFPEKPCAEPFEMLFEPVCRHPAWSDPLSATFLVARWKHENGLYVASVPSLGIDVVAETEEDREEQLPNEIRSALTRAKVLSSLKELVNINRAVQASLHEIEVTADFPTVKAGIAKDAEEEKPDYDKFLRKIGRQLQPINLPRAYEMDKAVARLADVLGGETPRSALLVGPSGVGKTAIFLEFVARTKKYRHAAATRYFRTSGSQLISGMSGFGMWQERCQQLLSAAGEGKLILHMGNLVELMEVGKSARSKEGMATFLRPHFASGKLLAVVECTPEQIPLIEQESPQLLEAFTRIDVDEPSDETTKSILLEISIAASGRGLSPAVDTDCIELIERLHRRYTPYSARPGRPIRLLENVLRDIPYGEMLTSRAIVETFSEETGLPLWLLDDARAFDLAATRAWFAERVIGQDQAVDLVSDLLAVVKTELNRPCKPIASLMFIGPTGVGKTYLAKCLAENLFGDANRMVRFDMSEFNDPISVKRLIGGVFGSEGLLTRKVREQPFCVVLFDEFEKAHPLFFDLLLQILGEGRLCDAGGRIADFCSSVVVMTSNLGARSFQRGTPGFQAGNSSPDMGKEHFIEEVRRFLRPELFNRIDRIVPFLSMSPEIIEQITRRELKEVYRLEGIRYRHLDLTLSEGLVRHLADSGFDSRYGARPLKRAIQHEFLVPLANLLNGYSGELPLAAKGETEGTKVAVSVRAHDIPDAAGQTASIGHGSRYVVDGAMKLRRQVAQLTGCGATVALRNQLYLGERFERERPKSGNRKGRQPHDEAHAKKQARLKKLKTIDKNLKSLEKDVATLEDEALVSFYLASSFNPNGFASQTGDLEKTFAAVLLELFGMSFSRPDMAVMSVYSANAEILRLLAGAYRDVALANEFSVHVARVVLGKEGGGKKRMPCSERIEKNVDGYFSKDDPGAIGITMEFQGFLAFPLFEGESGLQVFKWGDKKSVPCFVAVQNLPLAEFKHPADIERKSVFDGKTARRTFNVETKRMQDKVEGTESYWSREKLPSLMTTLLEDRLKQNALKILTDED